MATLPSVGSLKGLGVFSLLTVDDAAAAPPPPHPTLPVLCGNAAAAISSNSCPRYTHH